jgi:hypothetical protein
VPRPVPTKRCHNPGVVAPRVACLCAASVCFSRSAACVCVFLSVDFRGWFLALAAEARDAASLTRGWAERDSSWRQAREARESM